MVEVAETILDGKYLVERVLGVGAYGRVILAKDTIIQGNKVAIKVLLKADSKTVDLLVREMEYLSTLRHPGIVTFYHHFKHDDQLCVVMEYCEKGNLRTQIETKEFRPNEAFAVGAELADTLQFVHDHNIVHHDVKPENILIASDGKIKIGDFGVANQRLGTLAYMPPEMSMGDYVSTDDPRFDVYSLGVTILEIILGDNPLFAMRGHELLLLKMKHSYIPNDLPKWVQEVLLKATHPTPELRFQTMSDFAHALRSKSAPFVLDKNKMLAHELAAKAEKLIERQKWKEALFLIRESLQTSDNCVAALVAAGKYELRLNRTKKARSYFANALQSNARANVQKELGWIELEDGRLPYAISMLSDYLHRNSSDYEAVNLLIQCYYLTDRYEQVIDLCKSVIRKNQCFRNNYLLAIMLMGDAEKRIERLESEKSLNPFIAYNASVFKESEDIKSQQDRKYLKSKLLFQDFRFGRLQTGALENTVKLERGGRLKEYSKGLVAIGRLSVNDYVIRDNSISRRHCVIVNAPNDVWIYDLNSTVGTSVEDERVSKKHFILGVKEITVGSVHVTVTSRPDYLL